ncbi:MAG TPA: sn-glycerol-3-phosphate ABC transporter ATP-binding protein UgpC [Gaiellaceae bacterium]|nr:sn-glycerol-3-phosphate ABC transporter ATP-binding protein UgpC [Gaiellaceae bacterium]
MAEVEFNEVDKVYDNGFQAVTDLSFDVHDGEFLVLVGPSGCGKTTALRMVAGLEEISDGTISIGGTVVNELTPKERDIAMVFQNYALYPHLSVAENIAFGLRLRKTAKSVMNERVQWAARLLDLTPYLNRRPKQLSGGQRQRVAMGRAIVRNPQVFLMDEPLSNLDAKLRVQMRADIAALQSEFGITTVYVTHDQSEAMTLGHRVAVLKDGRLQQCAAPRELYERPVNTFVAGFIGSPTMNLCTVPLGSNGAVSFGGVSVPLPAKVASAASANGWKELVLGLRPESLELASEGVPAHVVVVEELGADAYVFCASEVAGDGTKLVARTEARRAPERGAQVALRPVAEDAHLFDPTTGDRLES